jgi:hypothetical protein
VSDSSQVNKTSRMNKAIVVWRFEDAPPELQKLSPHGGDEDGCCFRQALIQMKRLGPALTGRYSATGATAGTAFVDGYTVVIAAHA